MKLKDKLYNLIAKTFNFYLENDRVLEKTEYITHIISFYYIFIVIFNCIINCFFDLNINDVMLLICDCLMLIVFSFTYMYIRKVVDTKNGWPKRKITLKILIVIFSLTRAKSYIASFIINIIYLFRGFANTAMPGSVEYHGTTICSILSAIIIGPIVEEIMFRGFGLSLFKKSDNKIEAIIFTSVLFGLMHSNVTQAIYATIGGLIYGYLTIEYGILYSILFHMLNNAIVYLEYFFGITTYLDIFTILVIVILFLYRKDFVKIIKNNLQTDQSFSIKRQLVYFLNPILIMWISLWIYMIIISF